LELLPILVLYMIEILSPLEKYKYDTWRILPVKCYIDNSVHLWCCIRNVNKMLHGDPQILDYDLGDMLTLTLKRKEGIEFQIGINVKLNPVKFS
jgi:hypothetical protein